MQNTWVLDSVLPRLYNRGVRHSSEVDTKNELAIDLTQLYLLESLELPPNTIIIMNESALIGSPEVITAFGSGDWSLLWSQTIVVAEGHLISCKPNDVTPESEDATIQIDVRNN